MKKKKYLKQDYDMQLGPDMIPIVPGWLVWSAPQIHDSHRKRLTIKTWLDKYNN
jgi:hypothetical protein